MATTYFVKVRATERHRVDSDIQFTVAAEVTNELSGEKRSVVATFWKTALTQLTAAQSLQTIRRALGDEAFPDSGGDMPSIPDGKITI